MHPETITRVLQSVIDRQTDVTLHFSGGGFVTVLPLRLTQLASGEIEIGHDHGFASRRSLRPPGGQSTPGFVRNSTLIFNPRHLAALNFLDATA